MPRSLWGTGTTYYGRIEPRSDGSYITTEWITWTWIPLIPIGSYRVLEREEDSENDPPPIFIFTLWSQGYWVKKVPMHMRQVRNVYLTVFSIILGFLLLAWVSI